MEPALTVARLAGPALEPHVADLARLRIAVFREFPYCYEGDLAYEENHLRRYLETPGSVFVLARAGTQVVGVATGCPLIAEAPATQELFARHGPPPASVFYFGESVLLPAYRGRGLGHRFFDQREAHARALGRFAWTAFCAVERAPDDPRRPASHRPLDAFWQKRGYVRRPELHTTFTWRELGAPTATAHPMVFWLRALA